MCPAEYDSHTGVIQKELEAPGRIGWIQRDVRTTSFEYSKKSNEHLWGSVRIDPHALLRPDAELAEFSRQSIGPSVKLAVAEAMISQTYRRGSRSERCVSFEQAVETDRGPSHQSGPRAQQPIR
ncbi:MAG: hypothetical protein NVSMB9_03620 [Isosphaeraceae bacterium]